MYVELADRYLFREDADRAKHFYGSGTINHPLQLHAYLKLFLAFAGNVGLKTRKTIRKLHRSQDYTSVELLLYVRWHSLLRKRVWSGVFAPVGCK